jgi:hypothetical protein
MSGLDSLSQHSAQEEKRGTYFLTPAEAALLAFMFASTTQFRLHTKPRSSSIGNLQARRHGWRAGSGLGVGESARSGGTTC